MWNWEMVDGDSSWFMGDSSWIGFIGRDVKQTLNHERLLILSYNPTVEGNGLSDFPTFRLFNNLQFSTYPIYIIFAILWLKQTTNNLKM